MRLIYATGFSKSEREEWRAIIFSNILGAFKIIIAAMEDLSIPFDQKQNEVRWLRRPIFCILALIHPHAAIHIRHLCRPRSRSQGSSPPRIPERVQGMVGRRWCTKGHGQGQRVRSARQSQLVSLPASSKFHRAYFSKLLRGYRPSLCQRLRTYGPRCTPISSTNYRYNGNHIRPRCPDISHV